MKSSPRAKLLPSPLWAWLTVALSGAAAPALAMLLLGDAPLAPVGSPILAVALMAVGMIGAAAAGRLWMGVLLALLTGVGLILLARMLGMPALPHPFSTGLAMIIASCSFAARGTLFSRASSSRGWWIAVSVVAGEAATVLIVFALPGLLPNWLLVLLPAQWASAAIQTALTGTGTRAAGSVLIALAGTAATTLLVVVLWPRRWPYLLMFTAWLSFSALVWNWPVAPQAAAPQPLPKTRVAGAASFPWLDHTTHTQKERARWIWGLRTGRLFWSAPMAGSGGRWRSRWRRRGCHVAVCGRTQAKVDKIVW